MESEGKVWSRYVFVDIALNNLMFLQAIYMFLIKKSCHMGAVLLYYTPMTLYFLFLSPASLSPSMLKNVTATAYDQVP